MNFSHHYNTLNGLHGKRIYALHEDSKGKIWISASNNGIATFDGSSFEKIEQDEGYIDLKSKTILEDSENRIWIGTQGGGLVVLDTNRYKVMTIKDGLPSSWGA